MLNLTGHHGGYLEKHQAGKTLKNDYFSILRSLLAATMHQFRFEGFPVLVVELAKREQQARLAHVLDELPEHLLGLFGHLFVRLVEQLDALPRNHLNMSQHAKRYNH